MTEKTDSARTPAECFPVGHYLAEELEARGWSTQQLAVRMAIDQIGIYQLEIELLLAVDDPNLRISEDTAKRLGQAMDVAPQFFLNLQDAYIRWSKSREVGPISGPRSGCE